MGWIMRAALYDVLRGTFGDGTSLDAVDEYEHVLYSVVGNLTHLFNTRQGSLPHLPDYGLPDIASAFRDQPHSIDDLSGSIRKAVETYEPRLRHVRLEHRETDRSAMRLVFWLTAEMTQGQRVRLKTTFASENLAQVRSQGRVA